MVDARTKSYYALLGVLRTATADEIKTAYRKLACELHPDVNPGDAAVATKFAQINEAHDTLKDPEKRKDYDLSLSGGGSSGGGSAQQRAASGGYAPSSGNPMEDILNNMRGTARQNATATATPATDSTEPTVTLRLTPREALEGVTKRILINGRPLRIKIEIQK
jgi:molecular chaperone DnaJ